VNLAPATVPSFARYCSLTRILAIEGNIELQRRPKQHDHTRSIPLTNAPCGGCSRRQPPAPGSDSGLR
jgi:hypothetical protein